MDKKKTLIIAIIAVAVLVGVMLLLLFLPKGGGSDADTATADEGIRMELSTDEKGVHQAIIGRDAFGNVENNSSGTLMQYVPADIKTIHVENTYGCFDVVAETPEGDATVYTMKGYEEFTLQSGAPDAIANAAASLAFTQVAGQDNGGSEFGFDAPRSVVTVTYSDDTSSVITVGNDAPQGKGTYVKFGDGKDIFLVETSLVSAFDYSVNDMISKVINDSASASDSAQASVIEVEAGGESFAIEPYTGEKYQSHYLMTKPESRFANEMESSRIEGGIRGLYADMIVMVNPSEGQYNDLGLSYATLTAEYSDGTVKLHASQPDAEGKVNLMLDGRNVVYQLAADKVAWVSTSYEKLVGEYVLYPKMTALKGMKVNDRDFTLSTRVSHTTDDEGNESTSTVTTVFEGSDEIQIENFQGFCDEAGMIALADAEKASAGGTPELTIVYTFDDDTSDTLEFYAAGDSKYVAAVNGTVMGHARKSDITRVTEDLAKIGK